MKASNKQKTVALFFGVVVSALAIFAGEFSSHGETLHETTYALNIDEQTLMERAVEEMKGDDFVVDEPILKTIKIYDDHFQLIEQVSLWEGQEVEDLYTLQLLNKASFLSGHSNVKIYQVHE